MSTIKLETFDYDTSTASVVGNTRKPIPNNAELTIYKNVSRETFLQVVKDHSRLLENLIKRSD